MIIACPECKREVSDRATMCPYCGFDFDSHRKKKEEEKAHAEAMRNQAIEAERQRKYDLSLWPNKLYLMAPWPVKPLFRPLVFAGRAPRIEFWSYLAFYVLSVVFGLIVLACMNMTSGTWFVGVYIIYGFVCLFSCFIRRYHDAIHVNYSPITGLVALICLAIPGIGWIVALWLCEVLNPSQEGSNKYGANPFTYYHTRNLGYCCAKSNIGNEMNRSVNSNNVPYEFEWRRLATAEKIQAAHKMCMRYAKYANYYNSAPVGAKEYISLVFYVTVYPEALDENSYVRQSEEVIRHLNEEDLEYLIRHEADSQMHKVFTTRLSEVRTFNNIGVGSQKDTSRQKGNSFRAVLKWFGVCAIAAIIFFVLYLIITVITAHKGKEKSNLEVQYERLLMLENKYGTNSVEYIEARIDLIRKYTLNINKELVDRHRNFMFVLNKAGYTVSNPIYSNYVLDSLTVHDLNTGDYGYMRRGNSEGQYQYPYWLSADDARIIWEHFYHQAVAECEKSLTDTMKLIADLEYQLDNLRLRKTSNDNRGTNVTENVMQDGIRGTNGTTGITDVLPVAALPPAATNENIQVGTNDLSRSVQKDETESMEKLEQGTCKDAELRHKEEAEIQNVQKSFDEVSKTYFPSLEWNAATRVLKKIGRSIQTDRGKKVLANHLWAIESLAEICQCLATESKGVTFKDGTVVDDSNEVLFRLCQYGYDNGRRIVIKETILEWKDFLGGKDSVGLLNQMLNKLILEHNDNIERAIAEKRLLGSALILKYFYPSVAGCEKFTLKLWEKAKKLQGFNDAENWEAFFSEQINVNVLGALGGDSLDDEKSQVRPAPAKSPSSFCGHRFGEKYLPKRMTREMWQEDGIAVKPVQTYYRQFRRLELGYAIEGKQLCMMRLHAHVSREAIEKEFQATKLDLERRFNMTMDSQGHEYGDTLQSSTDGACFEDNRYRIRLWMGTGTKFGIWLEIIDKLLHPSER